ncbi:MAG: hypothetical protein IKP34_06020 [Bacteroidales bacterium]|nr:hypothetical protein [Bacteroidales bacterium]
MPKVFDMQSELHENPNRNNFDGTYKRHMSGKFGYIYPFLCQPVVPSDTWEIDTAIGVNLMPMWYPTQTNMRFIVHYFYVPNRIIMKDWKNMLEGLVDAELPYWDVPAYEYRTGSLVDYLGIPTNYILPQNTRFTLSSLPSRISFKAFTTSQVLSSQTLSLHSNVGVPFSALFPTSTTTSFYKLDSTNASAAFLMLQPVQSYVAGSMLVLPSGHEVLTDGRSLYVFGAFFGSSKPYYDAAEAPQTGAATVDDLNYLGFFDFGTVSANSPLDSFWVNDTDRVRLDGWLSDYPYVYFALCFSSGGANSIQIYPSGALAPDSISWEFPAGSNLELAVYTQFCPYYHAGHTNNTVKVRSLAMRCYEMIYNSYYRDSHGVQPFVVNGETKYNEYITTDASGADTTHYELKSRNWELDAYTSCLPSPQQGNSPIIGVSVDGTMRIAHDDGTTSTVRLRDLDGSAGVEVLSSDIDPEHPEDARTVMSLSSSGMTISDFRYGNALTRFLETSLRTGFRYADFIFGHFGMSPKHQELDMPIFLGGYTQIVDTSKVTNVTASNDPDAAKLGQFAGIGASFDAQKHSIKHFFDDYGYVMGLVMLVPDPAYSQILPKHFTYNNRLDYYFPEFGQLGLQPITYEEVCPIQSYAEYVNGQSGKLLTDTFGYQRPNHDLVWFPDTVHGLFRTSLSGSVIQRRFGLRPELSDEFLKIKPEECNDIFSVVEANDDTWLGQIVCKITMQRPVPRVVIPSLGR